MIPLRIYILRHKFLRLPSWFEQIKQNNFDDVEGSYQIKTHDREYSFK